MTEYDYADMVDPFVKAEERAYERGWREGLLCGIFYSIATIIGVGMLLVALDAHAAEAPRWSYEEARKPLKASERNARISVCQQNAVERGWACFLIR